jgi:PleD family two-component response regulator
VSASMGMAVVAPGLDPERLLSQADAAMYTAKRGERFAAYDA